MDTISFHISFDTMTRPVQFKTIEKKAEGLYTELSSRFISFAIPASDENEIRTFKNQLKKTHHKAVHVVYAYRFGFSGEIEKCSDDGEPSGSAGLPVLNELRSHQLSNIAIFVVRYFGGKKLGVSGLIRAYRTAAADAIKTDEIIIKDIYDFYNVVCEEKYLNSIFHTINRLGAAVQQTEYGETCKFTIKIKRAAAQHLEDSLRQIWQATCEYAYSE